MSAKTAIEWTDASWNPIVGCTEVSPGCANCYAARLAASRLRGTKQYSGLAVIQDGDHGPASVPRHPRWTGEVRFLPERLEEPLHWKKPQRIFVCDMGDLFHESVHGDWIDQVIHIIDQCPEHTFQILTKRAKRMHDFLRHYPMRDKKNVCLGVSVENQHFADERIPLLLDTPAAVRFISAEPLLERVNLHFNWLRSGLGWVICGGESGPNARPMHPEWARSLRDQCQAVGHQYGIAGVPFFFKQWGEWLPEMQATRESIFLNKNKAVAGHWFYRVGKHKAGRLLDGREWNEFPDGAAHVPGKGSVGDGEDAK